MDKLDADHVVSAPYLPNTVLAAIFKHLDLSSKGRVALVCKTWKDVVYQKVMWTGREIDLSRHKFDRSSFPSLVERGIKILRKKSAVEPPPKVPQPEPASILHDAQTVALPIFPIMRLPVEILTMVFSFLNVGDKGRVCLVCKAWRDACYQPTVWKNTLFPYETDHSVGELRKLAERGVRCVKVKISSHTCTRLDETIRNFPRLSTLYVERFFYSDLEKLSSALHTVLPNITKFVCSWFNDQKVELICRQLPNLVVLHLESSQLSDTSVQQMVASLKKLTHLKLSSCLHLTDAGIKHLAEPTAPKLVRLCLNFCCLLTDQSMMHLANGQKQLRRLDLSSCTKITDYGLEWLIRLKELERLDLSGCNGFGTRGMKHLSKLVALKYLHLQSTKIKDSWFRHLVHENSKIIRIYLFECTQITNTGIDHLKRLPCLQELDIWKCAKLTDYSVKPIAEMNNLTKVWLQYCSIGDRAMDFFVQAGSKISVLCLRPGIHSIGVTNRGLHRLAQMTTLKELYLINCGEITSIGLSYLVVGKSELGVLMLASCKNLTSQTALQISRGASMTQLTRLVLDKAHVCTTGFTSAAQNLKHLSSFSIGNVEHIVHIRRLRDKL